MRRPILFFLLWALPCVLLTQPIFRLDSTFYFPLEGINGARISGANIKINGMAMSPSNGSYNYADTTGIYELKRFPVFAVESRRVWMEIECKGYLPYRDSVFLIYPIRLTKQESDFYFQGNKIPIAKGRIVSRVTIRDRQELSKLTKWAVLIDSTFSCPPFKMDNQAERDCFYFEHKSKDDQIAFLEKFSHADLVLGYVDQRQKGLPLSKSFNVDARWAADKRDAWRKRIKELEKDGLIQALEPYLMMGEDYYTGTLTPKGMVNYAAMFESCMNDFRVIVFQELALRQCPD